MKQSIFRIIAWFGAGMLLACAGCIGPHYTQHPLVLVKKKIPDIHGPNDPLIEQNLSTNPWPPSVIGPFVGVGDILFKSMGIGGWKDFHLYAKAKGVEVQHQLSSGGFLTVDMRLKAMTVDDVPVPITDTKYMRLEIYLGRVAVENAIRKETNELIRAEGKLVWDSDGWFEIHPQETGDVRTESTPRNPGDK